MAHTKSLYAKGIGSLSHGNAYVSMRSATGVTGLRAAEGRTVQLDLFPDDVAFLMGELVNLFGADKLRAVISYYESRGKYAPGPIPTILLTEGQ